MITYEQLIRQLKKHVAAAEQASTAAAQREALSAVKALCEVGLLVEVPSPSSLQRPLAQPLPSVLPDSFTEKTLEEPDANGSSLFDF